MSHTFQTSQANIYTRSLSSYMVTVEDFDNESYDFNVEAHSSQHASDIAARLCAEQNIDINIMCVYSQDF